MMRKGKNYCALHRWRRGAPVLRSRLHVANKHVSQDGKSWEPEEPQMKKRTSQNETETCNRVSASCLGVNTTDIKLLSSRVSRQYKISCSTSNSCYWIFVVSYVFSFFLFFWRFMSVSVNNIKYHGGLKYTWSYRSGIKPLLTFKCSVLSEWNCVDEILSSV